MSSSLLQLLREVLLPVLEQKVDAQDPAVQYCLPEELRERIDFSLGDDSVLQDGEQFLELIRDVFDHTPWSGHPYLFNYLYSQPDPVGLLGDFVVSIANTNVHTFDASPVFTLAEIEMVRALVRLSGFAEGADGIFCPGGSYSNMFAMFAARQYCERRHSGEAFAGEAFAGEVFAGEVFVVLASSASHYSIRKNGVLLGLKEENIVEIACDSKDRMIPADLRLQLRKVKEQGKTPMCVCATAGTTVRGSFDPLDEIADVLQEEGPVWLHVDAAWGGAVLLSRTHAKKMKGLSRADSLTFDFHKALGAPILCSAMLVNEPHRLDGLFGDESEYLFHDSDLSAEFDLGRKTAQCGRRGDAFKFWLMWKAYGRDHFGDRVDRAIGNSRKVVDALKRRGAFRVYDDAPSYFNVCFHYIPHHLRDTARKWSPDPETRELLSRIVKGIYDTMTKDGVVLLNYAEVEPGLTALRLIVNAPDLTDEEIDEIIGKIEIAGDQIANNGWWIS